MERRRIFNGDRINKLRKRTTPKATSLCSYRRSRHLPEDLLPEILRRLPVKSLLRFRCVSKTWLALVDHDADFARLHLDTYKNNSDQTRLFVGSLNRVFSVRSADTFESILEIPYEDRAEDFFWPRRIVSSVDGLILLGLINCLTLWNPSLRKLHQFPHATTERSCKKSHIIGLGYDLLLKDYKIVTLVYDLQSELPSVGIYTVGAGSWKTIPFQSNESSRLTKDHFYNRSVYLHGSLYFLHQHETFGKYRCLLWSFDLSNEVFSHISIPSDVGGSPDLFLVDGGSSLGVYYKNSIWVLERETMNWTKRCLWSDETTRLVYCKKNGDMLTTRNSMEGPSEREVASYCLEEDEFQQHLPCDGNRYIEYMYISTYVESLIKTNFR